LKKAKKTLKKAKKTLKKLRSTQKIGLENNPSKYFHQKGAGLRLIVNNDIFLGQKGKA
jgi:mRNA-degrading endonuclease RelE of RelBE toxin-antitoxin system